MAKKKKTSSKKKLDNFIEAEKVVIEEKLEKEEQALEALKEKNEEIKKTSKKVDEANKEIKESLGEKFVKKADATREKIIYKYDRVCAYLFDLLLVMSLVLLLSSNTITNPYYGNSGEAYEEYVEIYEANLEEIEEDGKTTPEEVQHLLEVTAPSYRKSLIRENVAFFAWFVIIYFFYFGLFQYLNNGQTLFKKLYRLRVVHKSGRKASLLQMIARSIFGGNKMLTTFNVPTFIILLISMLLVKDPVTFVTIYVLSSGVCVFIDFVFLFIFLVKKNGRTLDDLIGNTKVIQVPRKK